MDRSGMLGQALGLAGDAVDSVAGFTDTIKAHIRAAQGDGVSAQTHRAMLEAGIDEVHAAAKADFAQARRDDSYNAPVGATIAMPDGRRVTAIQYQALQQMLLKRQGM